MKPEELTCRPVNAKNWKDFEEFFESKGSPHYCWCMVWRNMIKGGVRSDKTDKKKSLKKYVDDRIPIGLLFYLGAIPVGWCSVAPREHYRGLEGDETLKNVWSIVCFFIRREYRGAGLTEKMIPEAVRYAGKNGAEYVEAYPVDFDSPSYRFMGFRSTFEKLGFEFKHDAGGRRHVMTLKV